MFKKRYVDNGCAMMECILCGRAVFPESTAAFALWSANHVKQHVWEFQVEEHDRKKLNQ